MKKKLTLLTILALITISSTLAFATVTYVFNKTIDTNITVGDTTVVSDGLIIELASYEAHTLTFFNIDQTDTMKHYITYIYSYEILVSGMNIEVSSLSNDIAVSELTYTDTTISITFSLNQELEYTDGQVLHIQFYFEAVEIPSININDTTIEELLSIGFTTSEATEIVALSYNVSSLSELFNYIYIADGYTRFEPLVNDGSLVFE